MWNPQASTLLTESAIVVAVVVQPQFLFRAAKNSKRSLKYFCYLKVSVRGTGSWYHSRALSLV